MCCCVQQCKNSKSEATEIVWSIKGYIIIYLILSFWAFIYGQAMPHHNLWNMFLIVSSAHIYFTCVDDKD